MLTPRENAMVIYNGGIPEYYGDLMDAIELVPDPVLLRDMPAQDGEIHLDSWGTAYMWLPGAPGPHPVVNAENAVIKDIENWERDLKVPDPEEYDYSMVIEAASKVDRKEKFVGFMFGGGLFERSHHLMGMEEALMDYLLYPDEMAAMLRVIADYKMKYIRIMAEKVHPDIIFYHDDWGHKRSMFLPPDVWRSIIKPLQQEISDCIHDCGMIYMHHADCICEPIVTDMVEIGVDIWQGVIPQNDIVKIQQVTEGKLAMVGGIDGPKIDIENITEEEIRAEIRRAIDTYCPAGRFFPNIPNAVLYREWNNTIAMDEKAKYGRIFADKMRAAAEGR